MTIDIGVDATLINEIKSVATRYYGLSSKPLGVTGEIAELEAARLMNLELAPAREAGFDAYGPDGRKIQIKGRWTVTGKDYGRVPSINTDKAFDTVMLVLLADCYDTKEIWEADRKAIISRLDAPGSKARNVRRSMGVSQFITIANRVWPAA